MHILLQVVVYQNWQRSGICPPSNILINWGGPPPCNVVINREDHFPTPNTLCRSSCQSHFEMWKNRALSSDTIFLISSCHFDPGCLLHKWALHQNVSERSDLRVFVWITNLGKSSSRTPAPPPPTSLPSSPHAASYPLLVSSLLDVDRLLLLGGLNRCPRAGQGRRERFVWNEIFVDLQRDWSPPCCWFDRTLPACGFCGTLCGHRWLRGNFIKSDLTLSLAYDIKICAPMYFSV